MEGLAENLSNNLPRGSFTSFPASPSRPADASSRANGWDVPQSVIDTAVQDLPVKLEISSQTPVGQEDAAIQSQSSRSRTDSDGQDQVQRALSPETPDSGIQESKDEAVSLLEGTESTSRVPGQSKVISRTLDWSWDVRSFQPPFDVLLVADVVSALLPRTSQD